MYTPELQVRCTCIHVCARQVLDTHASTTWMGEKTAKSGFIYLHMQRMTIMQKNQVKMPIILVKLRRVLHSCIQPQQMKTAVEVLQLGQSMGHDPLWTYKGVERWLCVKPT
jgi:hypothetical protein